MAAPQQGNPNDHSASILWGTAAVFAILGGVWFAFKKQIITFYLLLKLYQADFLNLFGGHFENVRAAILSSLQSPTHISFTQLIAIGDSVGNYLRFPFGIILFLLAVIVYFGNSTRTFKQIYDMKSLAKMEQTNWPHITPVVNLNLLKQDIDKGPWAMALNPMQFCKRYRLLEEVRTQREGSFKERNRLEVVLKRGEANQLFALQLGPMWRGVDKLPPHTKALFAVFAARINADSKAAANLLVQLAASSTSKLDYRGVDALLKKHLNTKGVQRIVQSHAYVMTVMASMLAGAREDGVQASADFLWLKPIDRRLWYTLNTVGRQTPFIEVAGIFSHWISEKEAGRKLVVPMVEEATKALELALTEVVYRPDEEAV